MRDDTFQVQRAAPHSLPAEQSLLGAVLIDNRAYERAAGIVGGEHFFDPLHRQIFETVARLITGGRLATPATLQPFFENAEPIHPGLSVPAYLGQIAANATTLSNVPDYARTIRDLATRRQLVVIGEDMVNAAFDSPVDFPPKEQIEEAERRLYSLVESDPGDRGSASARKVLAERMSFIAAARKGGVNPGITTGLRDLDKLLEGGMQPTDLVVLAGATSMGKSGMAGGIVMASPVPVALFTLEMSKEQMVDRMISVASGVPVGKLRSGSVDDAEFDRVREAEEFLNQRLAARDIIIDDTGGLSIAQLATRARRMKRQHGIGLIVADYIQLMRGTRRDSRTAEVGEISSGLKTLAKELDVPVLALAQLNREVDKRHGNRPHLSDLRESGSIEHDADTIMFVYREGYYAERDKPPAPAKGDKEAETKLKNWQIRLAACANKAEVIVAKARHGRVGYVDLHYSTETTKFSDIVRHEYPNIQPPERTWPYE